MKYNIIGTAGHIDHGKTTLVKALTGRNTDRLKEEQARGISIELGFTFFDLPSGKRAGIIDVPGHEKFIKNMLAGAASVDVVILVIAADEGVMPQTREHINILSLLQVQKGIIAITKKDIVDSDWLELIMDQVKEEVKGTFLEKAKMVPVSATTKDGIDNLIEEIDRQIAIEDDKKREVSAFRLPIDRVFTISGHGTIVTGTLLTGEINDGDIIDIYPQKLESKVRSIQVHDTPVKTAYAGQRVALNIANVKVKDIERGAVVARPGSLEPTMMVDARLELLKDAGRNIDNRTRLRLYHETSEVMCRVILLDRETLEPGEDAFVQLRLEETIACQQNDRFVIRFYSPMITIGGGTVLDPNPPKRKRYKEDVIEELTMKELGDMSDLIEQAIKNYSKDFFERKEIMKRCGNLEEKVFDGYIESLKEKNLIIIFKLGAAESYFIHMDYINSLTNKLEVLLNEYHNQNTLKIGMSKEEVKMKIFGNIKSKLSDSLFAYFEQEGKIKLMEQYISTKDFEVRFNNEQEKIKEIIMASYKENKFNPLRIADIIIEKKTDEKQTMMVYRALIEMKKLIKVDEDIIFEINAYNESIMLLREYMKEHKAIQLSEFRDLLGTSRKYAMALLDFFDDAKITKRVEDKRILI